MSILRNTPRTVFVLLGLLLLLVSGCGSSSSGGGGDGGTLDAQDGTGGDLAGDQAGDQGADQGGDEYQCYENVDIVFVLDVSTSMSYILQTLESEIGVVWEAAELLDNYPHFGLVVFVDDVTVASAQSYSSVESLQTAFYDWYSHTSTNQQTQSGSQNLDWPENSLDALVEAAEEFEWRSASNTLRIVIHATDDTFLEFPASFSSGIAVEHTYAQTLAALQQGSIRVAAFAAHLGGMNEDQDVDPGFFSSFEGQKSLPEGTYGEVFDIDQVANGTISLTEAINNFVVEEYCTCYGCVD